MLKIYIFTFHAFCKVVNLIKEIEQNKFTGIKIVPRLGEKMEKKTEQLHITLPVEIMEQIDDIAETERRNRSNMARVIFEKYIRERDLHGQ